MPPTRRTSASPTPLQIGIGAVTNFFDTLGIGSFATTTAMFRLCKMVPDRIIPGTLNVGHTLPDRRRRRSSSRRSSRSTSLTLFSMIAAAVLGAWLGAGVVAAGRSARSRSAWASALLAAATFMLMRQLSLLPGRQRGARRARREAARSRVGGNFLLGALMTLGIGLYAPCMILVSLLGMNERTAFPIMMGSCAFLMPVGSLRFIREQSYSLRSALGLAIGGVAGRAASPPILRIARHLDTVRWLVIVVVVYTAVTMLLSASRDTGKRQCRLSNAECRLGLTMAECGSGLTIAERGLGDHTIRNQQSWSTRSQQSAVNIRDRRSAIAFDTQQSTLSSRFLGTTRPGSRRMPGNTRSRFVFPSRSRRSPRGCRGSRSSCAGPGPDRAARREARPDRRTRPPRRRHP